MKKINKAFKILCCIAGVLTYRELGCSEIDPGRSFLPLIIFLCFTSVFLALAALTQPGSLNVKIKKSPERQLGRSCDKVA